MNCAMAVAVCLGLLVGCEAPGVGEPCEPETIPSDDIDGDGRSDGFVGTEAYLETSSVQCRTRVCMVYKLNGDPRPAPECNSALTLCANPLEVAKRVYCTCRCGAPESTATVCECPDGYTCEEILELGGDGIRGSYCVLSGTVGAEG